MYFIFAYYINLILKCAAPGSSAHIINLAWHIRLHPDTLEITPPWRRQGN